MRFGKTENNKLSKSLQNCLGIFIFFTCVISIACQTNSKSFDEQLKQCVESNQNNVNERIFCLEKLLEKNADKVVIYSFLADDYRKSGEIDKAERAVKIFVDSYPLDALGHESFCKILLAKGSIADALAECERAVKIQPKDIYIRLTTATVHEAMGNFKLAESTFRNALDINPQDVITLISLGSFYERLGRLDDAIEVLEKAVELKPSNYKKIEEGIKKLKAKREIEQTNKKDLKEENPKQPKSKKRQLEQNENRHVVPPKPRDVERSVKQVQRFGRVTVNPYEKTQTFTALRDLERLREESNAFWKTGNKLEKFSSFFSQWKCEANDTKTGARVV